jgi:hypothetical protein
MRPHISKNTRRFGWFLVSMLLVGTCGCGRTAKVTGKVAYQGRPVTYGSVMFFSPDKTVRSAAIEADGSYTVEGVPRGPVQIAVISRDPSKGRSVVRGRKPVYAGKMATGAPATAVKGWFPLPLKFEAPGASSPGCTVDSSRVSYDIDLK